MARRNDLGTSWWSRQWLEALETRALRDPNRLPRGRTYARKGAVFDLDIAEGAITANVQGSRARPYKVTIGIRRFRPEEWDTVFTVIASQAGFAAELIGGSVPRELISQAADHHVDLLPTTGDLSMHCSCPDWAVPCKHLAAACYLTASALDEDPFQLLLLRGLSRDQIDRRLRTKRSEASNAATTAGDTLELVSQIWSRSSATNEDQVALFNAIARTPNGDVQPSQLSSTWRDPGLHPELGDDVKDAAERAASALLDGTTTFTTLDIYCDAARLAVSETRDGSSERGRSSRREVRQASLAARLRMPKRFVEALAASWIVGGVEAVAVAVALNAKVNGHWPLIDPTLVQLARQQLAEEGVRIRVAQRWLTVVGKQRRIIVDDDGRWWRVDTQGDTWRVAGTAELDDLAGLCD